MNGPNPKRLAQAQAMGEIVHLMTRNSSYGRHPLVAVRLFLEPAILLGQYRIFYDSHSHPVGYFTWAHLADDVHQRLTADRNYVLKLSEWTEGPHLWIRDFLALPGFAGAAIRGIVQELGTKTPIFFHGRRPPHSVRRYTGRRYTRQDS